MENLDQPEARIIPTGEPVEGGDTIFAGSLEQVREHLANMPIEQQTEVSIWTRGHIFSAIDFLNELPGLEHDPQPAGNGRT